MFKKLELDKALIVTKSGVYKPTDVYEGPEGGLYVAASGGFVRVYERGSTSSGTINLHMLHRDGPLFRDPHGRLCVTGEGGRKPVQLGSDTEGRMLIENKS